MMKEKQLVLQESASQLSPMTYLKSVDPPEDVGFQILTETLDQALGPRLGTYCTGVGNARRREPRVPSSLQSKSQVAALTAEVADLKTELTSYTSQMSLIVQALSQSSICLPDLRPPLISKPFQPEHGHTSAPSTSELVDNLETFQPSPQDDHVDYAALFKYINLLFITLFNCNFSCTFFLYIVHTFILI